jgi:hypothetical protein
MVAAPNKGGSYSVTSAKQLKKSWKTSDIALWRISTGRRHHLLYYSDLEFKIIYLRLLGESGAGFDKKINTECNFLYLFKYIE